MKPVTFLLLTVLGGFAVPLSFAQTWTQTSAPNKGWMSVASSADGAKLVAVNNSGNGGHIFTSTNGGLSWVTNAFAGRNWTSVASSADGTKLIATANTGGFNAGI